MLPIQMKVEAEAACSNVYIRETLSNKERRHSAHVVLGIQANGKPAVTVSYFYTSKTSGCSLTLLSLGC